VSGAAAELLGTTPEAWALAVGGASFMPGFTLRLAIKVYPAGDERRARALMQFHQQSLLKRPFFVADEVAAVLVDGLPRRLAAAAGRMRRVILRVGRSSRGLIARAWPAGLPGLSRRPGASSPSTTVSGRLRTFDEVSRAFEELLTRIKRSLERGPLADELRAHRACDLRAIEDQLDHVASLYVDATRTHSRGLLTACSVALRSLLVSAVNEDRDQSLVVDRLSPFAKEAAPTVAQLVAACIELGARLEGLLSRSVPRAASLESSSPRAPHSGVPAS
jgi:hypothetical protein